MLLKKKVDLRQYSTFNIGGIAEFFAEPASYEELQVLLQKIKDANLEPFFFGFGSNLLFPDFPSGTICYVSLKLLNGFTLTDHSLTVSSGLPLSLLSIFGLLTANRDFDFTYLLPGSVGAGIFINARYLEREVSQIVGEINYIDLDSVDFELQTIGKEDCHFAYKSSVFQVKNRLIISAGFPLSVNTEISNNNIELIRVFLDKESLSLSQLPSFLAGFQRLRISLEKRGFPTEELKKIESKRESYGHFSYPSAGSVFKNDRRLGQPVGKIIDGFGLKGKRCGEAMISPHHGNIIINCGQAKAADVISLMDLMKEAVYREYGTELSPEIVIVK
jgi:UDP-N-acetylmuramate dehydrogenase